MRAALILLFLMAVTANAQDTYSPDSAIEPPIYIESGGLRYMIGIFSTGNNGYTPALVRRDGESWVLESARSPVWEGEYDTYFRTPELWAEANIDHWVFYLHIKHGDDHGLTGHRRWIRDMNTHYSTYAQDKLVLVEAESKIDNAISSLQAIKARMRGDVR